MLIENRQENLSIWSTKIGFVIQARMRSSRLPGKILKPFCSMPMLLFLTNRIKNYQFPFRIIVATTDTPFDDPVERLCIDNQIECFRGDELNVFDRFLKVAAHFNLEHLIRISGDNPLIDFKIIKTCIEKHIQILPDLTSTREIKPDFSIIRYTPKGQSVDIIKSSALFSVNLKQLTKFEKEHVIPVFFRGNYSLNIIKDLMHSFDLSTSYSVDTIEDFVRVEKMALKLLKKRI